MEAKLRPSPKINNVRQHHKRVSQCTACGGPLAQSRVTIKNSEHHPKISANNNLYYHSNNLYGVNKVDRRDINDNSMNTKSQRIENDGGFQLPIKITTSKHVKGNNVCVKYVNTPLPKTERFRISSKCIKRKLWSFTYNIVPKKYKYLFEKNNKASKFDRCRPMIVSLECKCGGKEKMHITKKLQAYTLLDKNIIFPQCNCESSHESKLYNKIVKKEENFCTHGCVASLDDNSSNQQNKNSFCFLFLSR